MAITLLGQSDDRSDVGNRYGRYHVGGALEYSDPLREGRLTMKEFAMGIVIGLAFGMILFGRADDPESVDRGLDELGYLYCDDDDGPCFDDYGTLERWRETR